MQDLTGQSDGDISKMNGTFAQLNGRRAWYVPSISIWGNLAAETVDALVTETDDTATRVVFCHFDIAGQVQEVPFASLTDHRGNLLPAVIDRPVVIPIPKNAVAVAVAGQPSDVSFHAGKTTISSEDGIIDLWVIEAGA
jgi:hypothetical protein